jgi:hypothetical protein
VLKRVRPVVIPKIFQISPLGRICSFTDQALKGLGIIALKGIVILSVMDLQSPSVLAQLPRPLHASTGKTRISDVYSLADAKKRKRYEVAVAVDGEAVNIYNVRYLTLYLNS